ncbi:hypothetical protein JTE90_004310 [Oedothorax gibbosus]|uniref:Uncharacterized protein n=1 Tax=Oedothorax gibbosus TaxID=931172 RepID=A0AAV6VMV5_9ARAC|nr:hypothetical protein JTE90_004310 [Oedothorax gibbosus]
MPHQLLLLILLLSTLQQSQCAKFQIAYKDYGKSSKLKELHPVKRASNIQCASHCLRKIQDCDGFSLDSGRTCRILKGEIKEGDCPGEGCVVRKGYSVFKKNE